MNNYTELKTNCQLLTPTDISVLNLVILFVKKYGVCKSSQESLARKVGITREWCNKRLAFLESLGLIRADRRHRHINYYFLTEVFENQDFKRHINRICKPAILAVMAIKVLIFTPLSFSISKDNNFVQRHSNYRPKNGIRFVRSEEKVDGRKPNPPFSFAFNDFPTGGIKVEQWDSTNDPSTIGIKLDEWDQIHDPLDTYFDPFVRDTLERSQNGNLTHDHLGCRAIACCFDPSIQFFEGDFVAQTAKVLSSDSWSDNE